MPHRQPPQIKSGPLSPQDAYSLNEALAWLYRNLGGFTASAPLFLNEDATGMNLSLASSLLPSSTGTLEVKTTNPGTGDSPVDVSGVTIIEIDQASGLQEVDNGGGNVTVQAQPASGTHAGVVDLSAQVMGLGEKGFELVTLLETPGVFTPGSPGDVVLGWDAAYFTGVGGGTNSVVVNEVSPGLYFGTVGCLGIYFTINGIDAFDNVWFLQRDPSLPGMKLGNVAAASRGTFNELYEWTSGANLGGLAPYNTPGIGWFHSKGGVFAGAGFATLDAGPSYVAGVSGTATGANTLTIVNGIVTAIV